MSLYGEKFKIGGLSCGLVLRGSANGEYRVVFEREYASLEQIEALEWDPPILEGECILPEGYGFTVKDIQYSAATRSYRTRATAYSRKEFCQLTASRSPSWR